jgi:hypothetical protein
MTYAIIYPNDDGGVCISSGSETMPAEEVIAASVPIGKEYKILDADAIPSTRLFRDAWCVSLSGGGMSISINMDNAKGIAHNKRRLLRENEFEPLDKEIIIGAADPDVVKKVEALRKEVRAKYAAMQVAIDSAVKVEDLYAALS